jgi:hypothetical protein
MKSWASTGKPPENGRARLLWAAANASKRKPIIPPLIFQLQKEEHSTRHTNELSQTLFFNWMFEHSLQSGMAVALRLC